jgi:arginyl-tRNA synthetase
MKILSLLSERIEFALLAAGAPEGSDALLAISKNPDFGDYQANGVMSAAKKLKQNPRELAAKVIEHLKIDDMASHVEVAGPGFINIFLNKDWLAAQLLQAQGEAKQLVETETKHAKVLVDYSGPNLAKEMHVGHLRSTIIGDAVANVLELLGDEVIRQNHVGDWGTQFGMLITLLAEQKNEGKALVLSDLEQFYRAAKLRFDEDENFAKQARLNVVALQSGDPHCLELWQAFTDQSLTHCFDIYKRLGVTLNASHTYAESAYNPELPNVISNLAEKKLLQESEGAQCVFIEGFETKDGTPLPIIVQKSDGGFLYATTDLAAIRYRTQKLNANRLLYFVDIRQSLHFKQMFQLSKLANFANDEVSLEHMPFGTMLGEDKRPFKTRSGDLVKLEDLLNEAETRAYDLVSEKQPTLAEDEKKRIARQVGIGAVKYADLSKNRTSDYVFSWESMLSFEGNTAPYLQYAYARVQSIFRKFAEQGGKFTQPSVLILNEDAESKLALKVLQVNDVLTSVAKGGFPHYLCEYLFELTQAYMSFYEQCSVLNAKDSNLVQMRLYLCSMTASTLKLGLDVLGIETPESM